MRSRALLVAAGSALLVGLSLLRVDASAGETSTAPQLAVAAPVVRGVTDDTSTPFNLVSMPDLARERYDGRGLRLEQLVSRTRWADRWAISYDGGGQGAARRLTGALVLPRTPGRHPVVVSLHGFAMPGQYRSGAGLSREEAVLGRQGYVVLHPDYRNWGGSAITAGRDQDLLGYPEDVLDAIVALRRARLAGVDTSRMALLGRSMGGGVAVQVAEARPSWFRGLLLYSPVSTTAALDLEHFVRPGSALHRRVVQDYGTPATDPTFWRQASSSSYFSRLRRLPVQIHHGTADLICPELWSQRTASEMRAAGVRVSLRTYPHEPHRFERTWPLFMRRAATFFATTLR